MKLNRSVIALCAVAALAFVAGRSTLLAGAGSIAVAQDETGMPEMSDKMMAMMEAGTPGDHHKHLNALVGDWEGEWTIWMEPDAPPMKSTGPFTRKWILDGRYLMEKVTASAQGMEFEGIGFTGYNNMTGEFEMVWMDNMSTAIHMETGTYDPEAKKLTTRGHHRDPATGRMIHSRGEMDMSNPNRHVYTGYVTGEDGKEYKHFHGVAERKKKSSDV